MKLYAAKYGPFLHTRMVFPESWKDLANVTDVVLWTLLPCTGHQARRALKKFGWDGAGPLGFIWLPPFLFSESQEKANDEHGLCVWHVMSGKTAYVLSDRKLPFLSGWKKITLKEGTTP